MGLNTDLDISVFVYVNSVFIVLFTDLGGQLPSTVHSNKKSTRKKLIVN